MPDDERKLGERWPCGCVAYRSADERLDVVFCPAHYRAWLMESATVPLHRRDLGERRHAPRISV
jgi:hypothetical protein